MVAVFLQNLLISLFQLLGNRERLSHSANKIGHGKYILPVYIFNSVVSTFNGSLGTGTEFWDSLRAH